VSLIRLMPCLILLPACVPSAEDASETDELSDSNFALSSEKDAHHDDRSLELVDDMLSSGIGSLPALVEDPTRGGCAVGIMLGDDVHYLETYGVEHGTTDLSLDSIFGVASVSKTITALAARDYGLADDDTVGDLTWASGDITGYTIRELRHMSVSSSDGETHYAASPPSTFDQTIPRLALYGWDGHTTMVASEAYSNANYAAIGGVLDAQISANTSLPASQRAYEPYVWAMLNDNLASDDGMLTASLLHERRYDNGEYDHLALGHDVDGFFRHPWNTAGPDYGPYGGWSMTIGDLTRLIVQLQRGFVVTSSTVYDAGDPWSLAPSGAKKFTLQRLGGGDRSARYVEMGGAAGDLAGTDTFYMHGGDFKGGAAMWMWWPRMSEKSGREDLGVAIVCNTAHKGSIANNSYLVPGGDGETKGVPAVWEYAMAIRDAYAADAGALALDPIRTNPVSMPDGATWEFDLRLDHAAASSPKQLFLPFLAKAPLALSLTRSGRSTRMVWVHDGRKVAAGSTSTLKSGFRTSKADLVLQTQHGAVDLEDAVFSATFSDEDQVFGTLSGRLDARDASAWVKPTEVCRQVVAGGGSCGACDDGSKTCFDASWSLVARGENKASKR